MQKGYIYNDQMSMFGSREIIGFGNNEFQIKEIDRKLANFIIIKNHYSKKIFNNSYIHLGVFINSELLGVLQYGHLMNNNSVGKIVSGTENGQALELNRMWLSDKAERNSESRALSYSFKYIRGKHPNVKWIQSFADERCGGFGIVYQAASFCFYGEHKSDFWELDGQMYHNILMTVKPNAKRQYFAKARNLQKNRDRAIKHTLRQFRYIKFLDQRWKKRCLLTEKPYLKHYNGD